MCSGRRPRHPHGADPPMAGVLSARGSAAKPSTQCEQSVESARTRRATSVWPALRNPSERRAGCWSRVAHPGGSPGAPAPLWGDRDPDAAAEIETMATAFESSHRAVRVLLDRPLIAGDLGRGGDSPPVPAGRSGQRHHRLVKPMRIYSNRLWRDAPLRRGRRCGRATC